MMPTNPCWRCRWSWERAPPKYSTQIRTDPRMCWQRGACGARESGRHVPTCQDLWPTVYLEALLACLVGCQAD